MTAALIPILECSNTQSDWYSRVEIFLIDSKKELYSIGGESAKEYYVDEYVKDISDEQIISLFIKIILFKKTSDVSNGPVLQFVQKSQKNIKEYLDTNCSKIFLFIFNEIIRI